MTVPPDQARTPPVVSFGDPEPPPADEARIWIAVMQRMP